MSQFVYIVESAGVEVFSTAKKAVAKIKEDHRDMILSTGSCNRQCGAVYNRKCTR